MPIENNGGAVLGRIEGVERTTAKLDRIVTGTAERDGLVTRVAVHEEAINGKQGMIAGLEGLKARVDVLIRVAWVVAGSVVASAAAIILLGSGTP